jgi:ABC-2 type transport system permease protein
MLAGVNKYRHAFLVGLQSSLVYRWNFAVRGFFSLFQLVLVFILWGAAYA